MKNIHFIVNPIAGLGNRTLNSDLICSHMGNKEYSVSVKYSKYRNHATLLAQRSVMEGAGIIVACGGDGTINEVASCLVGTGIPLGIIPLGSGNGLASNLRIPHGLVDALTVIRQQNEMEMDVGLINGRYFFSNMGIGFDAVVIKNYESQKIRTFLGYIRAIWRTVKEARVIEDMVIEIGETMPVTDPFMIFISNSNVMGYKYTLTPRASLNDGKLDIMIIPKLGSFEMLLFGFLMLLKKPNLYSRATYFQTADIQISCRNRLIGDSQLDGEYHLMHSRRIGIRILEGALRVLVPGKPFAEAKYALNYL